MNKESPELWTRFLDRDCSNPGVKRFEEDAAACEERARWEAIREEMREALRPAGLEHPGFINARVLEEIEREGRRSARAEPVWLLRWALGGLGAAVVIALVWVPDLLSPRASRGVDSQVLAVTAVHPGVSATAFPAPGDRGVVIWLEGAPFIPAEDQLR